MESWGGDIGDTDGGEDRIVIWAVYGAVEAKTMKEFVRPIGRHGRQLHDMECCTKVFGKFKEACPTDNEPFQDAKRCFHNAGRCS